MVREISHAPNIRGHAIDFALRETVQSLGGTNAPSSGFKVVRRKGAYPLIVEDGDVVLALDNPLDSPVDDTVRVRRRLFCAPARLVKPDEKQIVQEIVQARVDCYFTNASDAHPHTVTVNCLGTETTIENIKRLETRPKRLVYRDPEKTARRDGKHPNGIARQWVEEVVSIYAGEGDEEQCAGQIRIGTQFEKGDMAPGRFEWFPGGFDSQTGVLAEWSTEATLAAAVDPDSDEWRIDIETTDAGLEEEVTYYYALFPFDAVEPRHTRNRPPRFFATPTGRYDMDDRLYRLLPGCHQELDEPTPDLRGNGVLRRFLQCVGIGFDQCRSHAEALKKRHNVRDVPADCLPHLAQWIGWDLDRTADALTQRTEILFAPELYRSVGTIPNIKVLVNHTTGWDSHIKEYAHNILHSTAPEAVHLWELFENRFDGTSWGTATPVSGEEQEPLPEQYEGRPAAIFFNGLLHLYWHTLCDGRWEIWCRQQVTAGDALQGIDPVRFEPDPENKTAHAAGVRDPAVVVDSEGIWHFWSELCYGAWNLWARAPSDENPIERVTQHSAADQHPTAVVDGSDHIWLFWQSDRRGPNDVWCGKRDESGWHRPRRLTAGEGQDTAPTACVDGENRIWLFWSTQLRAQCNIYLQIFAPPSPDTIELVPLLKTPFAVTVGPGRDESPAALFWKNGTDEKVWLLWHTHRDGAWQVWLRSLNIDVGVGGLFVSEGTTLKVTKGRSGHKEPGVVVDHDDQLRIFWRSQQRGWIYHSRSFRKADIANLKTYEDRLLYTIETGREEAHRYTPDTIGIYMTPDIEGDDLSVRNKFNIDSVLKRFLPARVRAMPIIEPATYLEAVFPHDKPDDRYQDKLNNPETVFPDDRPDDHHEDELNTAIVPMRFYGAVSADKYRDMVQGWAWAYSWGTSPSGEVHNEKVVSNRPRFRTWHIGVTLPQNL